MRLGKAKEKKVFIKIPQIIYITTNNKKSNIFKETERLRQGEILNSMLFALFLAEIMEFCKQKLKDDSLSWQEVKEIYKQV